MHHCLGLLSQPAASVSVSSVARPAQVWRALSGAVVLQQPDAAGLGRRCIDLLWHALHQQNVMHSPLLLDCRLLRAGGRATHASSISGYVTGALGRHAFGGAS